MNRYNLVLITYLGAILSVFIVWAGFWLNSSYLFTQIILASLSTLLIAGLIHHIHRTNRNINRFLFSLKHQDFNQRFTKDKTSSFNQLNQQLNDLLLEQENRSKTNLNKLLDQQLMLDYIAFPLFMMDENRSISYRNQTFQKSFNQQDEIELLSMVRSKNHASGIFKSSADQEYEMVIKTVQGEQQFTFGLLRPNPTSQKDDAWPELLRVVSHEFLNGVTALSTLSQAIEQEIQQGASPEQIHELTNRLQTRSQKLKEFANSNLQVCNVPASKKNWFSTVKLVERLQGSSKVDIQIQDRTNGNDSVFADEQQIEQVLLNLIINAEHALNETTNPLIKIFIEKGLQQTTILIQDNGCGIEAVHLNHIFTPFYTTRSNGQGIGLTLSRQILNNNGGNLFLVSSQPGETIFGMRLYSSH